MSDSDRTILSGGSPQGTPGSSSQNAKRNPLLIIGGIGCLLLLCAALLIGGGVYIARDRLNGVVAALGGETETPTSEPASAEASPPPTLQLPPTPTLPPLLPTPTPEAEVEATEEPTEEPNEPLPTVEPQIGEITFALGATDDYEPIDSGDSFEEGITEIHAIFDYEGLSPNFTWNRVWYLDGEEILSNSADWTGDEAGRFDYFIDAGGDPLTPGEWSLELYVEGDLLATGQFVIEAVAVAEATEEPTEAPETPTPSPTATATEAPDAGDNAGEVGGGGTYQLTFTKWDGGQHNLHVADTNGNNERFLFGRAAGPSWMPDGSLIFFYGEEGIDRQLIDGIEYVFDGISNGMVALQASPLPGNASEAILFQEIDWKEGTGRWANVSPDGQMVAFDAKPGGGDYRIFFLGTQDNQQFQFQILGEQADWSPDSQKIVYRSGRDGATGLWISNRDDSGHTLITNGGSDSFPAWSPDGETIAFSRDEGGNVDIYTVNVDGSNLQRLTEAAGPDSLPVYTPSGDIIFRSARSGSWGIWKMSGSGGNQTEIIPDAGVGPDWSFSRMGVR